MMNKNITLCLFLLLTSCYKTSNNIEPQISVQLNAEAILTKPSAFTPLSEEEKSQAWAKEYLIGKAFAKKFDLYRAISSFKRAEILIPVSDIARKSEIQYDILLCYYYAKRYDDLIDNFDDSNLSNIDKTFPAFHDLLTMLYESYKVLGQTDKEQKILQVLEKNYPETSEKLVLSTSIKSADFKTIRSFEKGFKKPNYLDNMLCCYEGKKKSVGTAKFLNAILPGSGYLYLGQKKSATTAFILNGLFIAAAYQFFHKGYYAAGAITVSFETGWYIGGIYGAGKCAKLYNERLYEKIATPVMNRHQLYPVLMLQTTF